MAGRDNSHILPRTHIRHQEHHRCTTVMPYPHLAHLHHQVKPLSTSKAGETRYSLRGKSPTTVWRPCPK